MPVSVLTFSTNDGTTGLVDAAGTNKYTYQAGGLLYTEGGLWASDIVTNVYLNGMRTNLSLQQPTGVWTNKFAWDAAKRLTNIVSPAGSFTNEYFAGVAGASGYSSRLIKRLLLPNLSIITNDYDSVGRQLGTWLRTSTGTALDSSAYGYNSGNQRTTFTNAAGTYFQYTYDNIGQLKIADSSVNTEDRGYKYDAAWNLNYRTNNGTLGTFTVDNKNELTSEPSWGTEYYDASGSVTQRFFGAHTVRNYTYDDENRLTRIDHNFINPQWSTTFTYDGLGRLRRRVELDGTGATVSDTRYIYDGMRVIQERNSSNTPTVSYTRGLDLSGTLEGAGGIGGLLALSSGYSGGNWSTHNFYHADGNGNITYIVDSSQALAASYRYDPFGKTNSSSGTLADSNIYRFSSKEVHANSGMYCYGYRFYDPDSQRWINRDLLDEHGIQLLRLVAGRQLLRKSRISVSNPVVRSARPIAVTRDFGSGRNALPRSISFGDSGPSDPLQSLNLYSFVANDPLDSEDPFGEKEWKWWADFKKWLANLFEAGEVGVDHGLGAEGGTWLGAGECATEMLRMGPGLLNRTQGANKRGIDYDPPLTFGGGKE